MSRAETAPMQVARELPGALWVMRCPTEQVAFASLKALDIGIVVSLLPSSEAAALGMAQEAAMCEAAGLTFLNFPIEDFGLPERAGFAGFVEALALRLQGGSRIAVHCRAGMGRSGMAASWALIALGWTADAAIRAVSEARGVQVPDTAEQAAFIGSFQLGHG